MSNKKKFSTETVAKTDKANYSTINKVKLMNSLAEVTDDEELAELLKKRNNGELIYNIFMEAIDTKLQNLMEGEKEAVPAQMIDALRASAMLAATIKEVQRFLSNLTNTQLLGTLGILNKNLGGQVVEINQQTIQDSALSINIPKVVVTPIVQQANVIQDSAVATTSPKTQPTDYPDVIVNVEPVARNPAIRGFYNEG